MDGEGHEAAHARAHARAHGSAHAEAHAAAKARAAPAPSEPGRNPIGPLDLAEIEAIRVSAPAASAQALALPGRRPLAGEARLGWLARLVALIDLTTLAGDDTADHVRRLCAVAREPVPRARTEALGLPPLTVGAVCVYHDMVETAVRALDGSGVPVAAVSAGFPAGLSPLPTRIAEIEASVAAGASEIDIVISRRHVLAADWTALHDEMAAFRAACGPAHVKAILAVGELGSLTAVARASVVCMMAGADVIKTSTGKEAVNATLPAALTMMRAIRRHQSRTGARVGFKPAGGISDGRTALGYMALAKHVLGDPWLRPDLLRFGASSLLRDVQRALA